MTKEGVRDLLVHLKAGNDQMTRMAAATRLRYSLGTVADSGTNLGSWSAHAGWGWGRASLGSSSAECHLLVSDESPRGQGHSGGGESGAKEREPRPETAPSPGPPRLSPEQVVSCFFSSGIPLGELFSLEVQERRTKMCSEILRLLRDLLAVSTLRFQVLEFLRVFRSIRCIPAIFSVSRVSGARDRGSVAREDAREGDPVTASRGSAYNASDAWNAELRGYSAAAIPGYRLAKNGEEGQGGRRMNHVEQLESTADIVARTILIQCATLVLTKLGSCSLRDLGSIVLFSRTAFQALASRVAIPAGRSQAKLFGAAADSGRPDVPPGYTLISGGNGKPSLVFLTADVLEGPKLILLNFLCACASRLAERDAVEFFTRYGIGSCLPPLFAHVQDMPPAFSQGVAEFFRILRLRQSPCFTKGTVSDVSKEVQLGMISAEQEAKFVALHPDLLRCPVPEVSRELEELFQTLLAAFWRSGAQAGLPSIRGVRLTGGGDDHESFSRQLALYSYGYALDPVQGFDPDVVLKSAPICGKPATGEGHSVADAMNLLAVQPLVSPYSQVVGVDDDPSRPGLTSPDFAQLFEKIMATVNSPFVRNLLLFVRSALLTSDIAELRALPPFLSLAITAVPDFAHVLASPCTLFGQRRVAALFSGSGPQFWMVTAIQGAILKSIRPLTHQQYSEAVRRDSQRRAASLVSAGQEHFSWLLASDFGVLSLGGVDSYHDVSGSCLRRSYASYVESLLLPLGVRGEFPAHREAGESTFRYTDREHAGLGSACFADHMSPGASPAAAEEDCTALHSFFGGSLDAAEAVDCLLLFQTRSPGSPLPRLLEIKCLYDLYALIMEKLAFVFADPTCPGEVAEACARALPSPGFLKAQSNKLIGTTAKQLGKNAKGALAATSAALQRRFSGSRLTMQDPFEFLCVCLDCWLAKIAALYAHTFGPFASFAPEMWKPQVLSVALRGMDICQHVYELNPQWGQSSLSFFQKVTGWSSEGSWRPGYMEACAGASMRKLREYQSMELGRSPAGGPRRDSADLCLVALATLSMHDASDGVKAALHSIGLTTHYQLPSMDTEKLEDLLSKSQRLMSRHKAEGCGMVCAVPERALASEQGENSALASGEPEDLAASAGGAAEEVTVLSTIARVYYTDPQLSGPIRTLFAVENLSLRLSQETGGGSAADAFRQYLTTVHAICCSVDREIRLSIQKSVQPGQEGHAQHPVARVFPHADSLTTSLPPTPKDPSLVILLPALADVYHCEKSPFEALAPDVAKPLSGFFVEVKTRLGEGLASPLECLLVSHIVLLGALGRALDGPVSLVQNSVVALFRTLEAVATRQLWQNLLRVCRRPSDRRFLDSLVYTESATVQSSVERMQDALNTGEMLPHHSFVCAMSYDYVSKVSRILSNISRCIATIVAGEVPEDAEDAAREILGVVKFSTHVAEYAAFSLNRNNTAPFPVAEEPSARFLAPELLEGVPPPLRRELNVQCVALQRNLSQQSIVSLMQSLSGEGDSVPESLWKKASRALRTVVAVLDAAILVDAAAVFSCQSLGDVSHYVAIPLKLAILLSARLSIDSLQAVAQQKVMQAAFLSFLKSCRGDAGRGAVHAFLRWLYELFPGEDVLLPCLEKFGKLYKSPQFYTILTLDGRIRGWKELPAGEGEVSGSRGLERICSAFGSSGEAPEIGEIKVFLGDQERLIQQYGIPACQVSPLLVGHTLLSLVAEVCGQIVLRFAKLAEELRGETRARRPRDEELSDRASTSAGGDPEVDTFGIFNFRQDENAAWDSEARPPENPEEYSVQKSHSEGRHAFPQHTKPKKRWGKRERGSGESGPANFEAAYKRLLDLEPTPNPSLAFEILLELEGKLLPPALRNLTRMAARLPEVSDALGPFCETDPISYLWADAAPEQSGWCFPSAVLQLLGIAEDALASVHGVLPGMLQSSSTPGMQALILLTYARAFPCWEGLARDVLCRIAAALYVQQARSSGQAAELARAERWLSTAVSAARSGGLEKFAQSRGAQVPELEEAGRAESDAKKGFLRLEAVLEAVAKREREALEGENSVAGAKRWKGPGRPEPRAPVFDLKSLQSRRNVLLGEVPPPATDLRARMAELALGLAYYEHDIHQALPLCVLLAQLPSAVPQAHIGLRLLQFVDAPLKLVEAVASGRAARFTQGVPELALRRLQKDELLFCRCALLVQSAETAGEQQMYVRKRLWTAE